MRPWTESRAGRLAAGASASMGPRPCGRGRSNAAPARAAAENASMGPRPCGRGRPAARRGPAPHRAASMGPRPCGRGRRDVDAKEPQQGPRLQWGHGLAAVDGRIEWHCWHLRSPASMGPRPCGRGRAVCSHKAPRLIDASMGPRPCGRGRTTIVIRNPMPMKLQWGHGLAAVDGRDFDAVFRLAVLLQWGHGLAAVDGASDSRGTWSAPGFNGATALRPWTDRRVLEPGAAREGFNGATALRPWTAALR